MYNVLEIEENINLWGSFDGCFLYNESMAERTTFKVGGKAAVFIEPKNVDSLVLVVKSALKSGVPFFILGGGSNIVFPDEDIPYAVVSTLCMDSIMLKNNSTLVCGAGCTVEKAVEFCLQNSLGGLETFAGLPGTVGGAVYMNARCYDRSVSDVLESAVFFSQDNMSLQNYKICLDDWKYKISPFQKKISNSVIVESSFKVTSLNEEEAERSKKTVLCFIEDRHKKGHFDFPSAGSVFKNNRTFGKSSGQIIDECGLKGLRQGDAQVAPWHGNIIINTGNAKAADIKMLVKVIVDKVYEKTGLQLEPEIIFVS